MQVARRAARALAFALFALALAAPSRALDSTLQAAPESASPISSRDEARSPSDTIAHLGSQGLASGEREPEPAGMRALRSELDRLRLENESLRADARWNDRLVGAGILTGGMLLGALLRAAAGRRPQPRIRF